MHFSITSNTREIKILFIASLITTIYWITSRVIDVYDYALLGAVFESIWIFMVVSVFAVPVIALIFLLRSKFRAGLLLWLSIIISIASLFVIIF